jgi:hypothetical protein
MVLQASGTPIKFSEIQSEFGGTNPISISEYYNNGSSGYVVNIDGISNTTNPIQISKYYGKSKRPQSSYTTMPTIISAGNSDNLIIIGKKCYYIFTSTTGTNTITFTNPIMCELLLVGGGGGGGGGLEVREELVVMLII